MKSTMCYEDIDTSIKEHIEKLNDVGYKTTFSCSGLESDHEWKDKRHRHYPPHIYFKLFQFGTHLTFELFSKASSVVLVGYEKLSGWFVYIRQIDVEDKEIIGNFDKILELLLKHKEEGE